MRKLFTCGALLVCSAALAVAYAQQTANPGPASETEGLDRLLADFAAVTAKLDIEGAEKLFLPTDNTPDGQNRQGHIAELRKDWKNARDSGASAGPVVEFRNTKKILRTDMLIRGPGGEGQVAVEFAVEFTRDGWKIVSMNNAQTR